METTRDDLLAPAPVVQWAQEFGELGGVLTSHTQLTAQLQRAGHAVTYVDTGSTRRALRALPRALRVRSLHLFHITRLWRAIVLAPLFAVLPGRTVLVLHSGSVGRQLEQMGPAASWLLRLALHAYDEVWAVNGVIRTLLPRSLAGRVRVVAPFASPPTDRTGVQVERDPRLLTIATNAGLPHYGTDLALDAFSIIRTEWPDARLRVLAYGHESQCLAELRRRVAELGWVEVSFDAGPDEVHRVLLRTGTFLRPTAWDGDSVAVREALAAGARVVATDTAPRPAGVELTAPDAGALAQAVLHGGRVSDGAGLAELGMAEAAHDALVRLVHPGTRRGGHAS